MHLCCENAYLCSINVEYSLQISTTVCSSVSLNHAELLNSSDSFSLFWITDRMNGSVLEPDNLTVSKYRLMLQMVSSALKKNGVKMYFGLDTSGCGRTIAYW